MPKLDPQKHAVASLTILIAVLVMFYATIIHPAISTRLQFQNRVEELQFQFSKLSDSANKSRQLEKELQNLGAQEADKTGFLEHKSEALAAADLQKHIKILVESNEGELISTQVVSQKEIDVFPQVNVKVQLRGNIEALRNILYRLNTEHPVLLINNLLVQSRQVSNGRRAQRRSEQLEVRFDVIGFMYQAKSL